MSLSIWDKLNTFPPLVCRLLARTKAPFEGTVVMSDEDIARRGSLTLSEVKSLSWLLSWDDVPVHLVRKFAKGCGIDFSSRNSMRTHRGYLKNDPTWKYLRKSPEWETKFVQMVKLYVDNAS